MLRTAAFACVVASAIAPAARGEQLPLFFTDHHWTVTLPEGWVAMEQSSLNTISSALLVRGINANFKYVAGFTRDPRGGIEYPYVLAQFTPAPLADASLERIQRELNADALSKEITSELNSSLSDLASNLSIGKPVLDAARRRIIMNTTADVVGVGKIKGLSIGLLAKEGIIQLNFYAHQRDYENQLPDFEAMLETFSIFPGHEWSPPTSRPMPRWAGGALIGAVVGGLAGLMAAFRKRADA
jgi:hypothetical protein